MKGTHRNAIFENVLLQSKLETQECSVYNLNRELYDNIGQLLSSTKLMLAMVAMELQQVPDTLRTAEHTVGKAIEDLRLLSKSISDEWTHQFSLIKHLQTAIERINTSGKTKIQLTSEFENLPLEPTTQVILSRVLHETISRIVRKVSPENIKITITGLKGLVEIKIEYDNNNNSPEKKKEQFFLNIQQRIKLLHGTIQQTMQHRGSTIIFSVPIEE